jgi:L-xylulokinase
MPKYLLGIDNGGSEIKCGIFDTRGREIAVSSQRLPIMVPSPNISERDLTQVWKANIQAIKEVLEKGKVDASLIVGIGLTGYGNGICFVDKNGNPTENAVVSMDNRAAAIVSRLKKDGTERRVFEKTCQTIWSAQPAALLPWFKENKPEVLEKSSFILGIKDYIRFKLTGEIYTEITEASSGCLYNLKTRQFDEELFDILGIKECFKMMPPCAASTELTGWVAKEASELTGLREGTPVAGGYFDIDAGALASGILDEEMLCLIAGTWSINEYLTKEACDNYDEIRNTATLSYKEGYYLVEDSSPTSASNFDWYIERFVKPCYPQNSRAEIYKICDYMIENTTPFDSDVVFVPYLFSSATNPDSKGAFFNLTSFHTQEHVLRAVYEGVVFSSLFHVKRLLQNGRTYKAARLSGGVAKSEVWAQMMSDALQLPVDILEGSQQSAQGAAMGAGIACGEFSSLEEAVEKMVRVKKTFYPNPEYVEIYQKKYNAFQRALEALDFFHTEVKA